MLEKIVWLALVCLIVVFFCLRMEVIHFSTFTPIFSASLLIAFLGGLALTGVMIFRLYKNKPTKITQVVTSLGGMLPVALLVFNLSPQAGVFPAIHDITTDQQQPPQFVLAAKDRVDGDNPVAYDFANLEAQQKSYPSLQSLKVQRDQEAVQSAVESVVQQMDWRLLGTREGDGWYLEAVATTAVFRFRDDVVIRVRPVNVDGETLIEVAVRSASRVGLGDMGTNAKRIIAFFEALQAELAS